MLHVGVQLEFEAVHEVLGATVVELKRNKEKILCPGPKDDVENIKVCNCKYKTIPSTRNTCLLVFLSFFPY